MIRLPTRQQIQTLESYRAPNCLSIYAAYIPPASDDNPNRIELRNQLKEARKYLSENGLDDSQIDTLLKPANKLIDGPEFRGANYKHSSALFLSDNFFEYYRLPTKGIASSVTLNNRFHLRPINNIKTKNPKYYLLTVSHNGVQLFKGDNFILKKLKFQEFPTKLKTSLNIDEYDNVMRFHRVGQAAMSKKSEKFHGQYDKKRLDKTLLSEYFHRIDRNLHRIIRGKTTPLILAGVDYLLPIYRDANTFPFLLDDQITGNTEQTSLKSLRQQASAIIRGTKISS